MVGGWSQNFDKETDWNLVTTPQPGLNGRQVKLSRGKFLGGSSGVNGTLCIRGSKQDYDDWGMPGWSGDEFFEYMKRAEHFHGKPWFKEEKSAHGYDGMLHTEPHDLAKISELLLESMEDSGLPLNHDMFSTGQLANGCGHAVRTVHKGIRSTGADFVKTAEGKGVEVVCDVLVDRIILENKKAVGVSVVDKDGNQKVVKARKEVIVSSGAYCSPAVLMRSGIGPKDELTKHGIEVNVELPGVGKNLLDHLIVFTFYEANKPGLTNDAMVYHDNGFESSYLLYKEKKTGVLSTFPFGAFGYARLDDRLQDSEIWKNATRKSGRDAMGLTEKQPHIEFFTTELYGGPKQYDKFPIEKKHAFSMITELFAPHSKGTVTLKSRDPFENPVIDCNYLSDPLDLLVLTEGVRFGNEIVMKGKATKDVVKGSWPADLTHHEFTERDQWTEHVKNEATTCYHGAGTCKMGKESDEMAVVDEKLKVRGVEGLRIVDVSVMPTLHGGHTQMPAYGIGEKAADLIKESWF
jgi:choline dehydrogenase-like flavoprotein